MSEFNQKVIGNSPRPSIPLQKALELRKYLGIKYGCVRVRDKTTKIMENNSEDNAPTATEASGDSQATVDDSASPSESGESTEKTHQTPIIPSLKKK